MGRFLLFSRILDFFYPPLCFGCGEEISGGFLCFSCYEKLFISSLAVCPKCGRPVPYFTRCQECQPRLNLSRVRALGLYQPPFKGMIEEFKYKGKRKLAEILGDALSLILANDPFLKKADLLVPIPLHPAKIRERGYNQSELLARTIARRTNLPVACALKRKRNTQSQTKLSSREERFRNMENVFVRQDKEEVRGKRIILIDDVLTSGATLSSAARVLLEGGAEEVYGLVVAKG